MADTGVRCFPLRRWTLALALTCVPALAPAVHADDFYAGKTINLIISTNSGGGLDTNARVIARHLPNHIPGKPLIVPMNMPGAGALRAANFLYNVAPKDGTTLGTLIPAFVLAQVVGRSGVQYDAAKFGWIGSTSSSNDGIYAWSSSGVKSIDDAFHREILMGATGAGSYSTLYPTVLNNVIGTRFKVVPGYGDVGNVNIAMQRGEVEGRAGGNLSTIRATNPQWFSDRLITLLVQIGVKRDRQFPDVPLMIELGKTHEQREVFRLFSTDVVIGRALAAPPGMPAERLALLRKAFEDMLADPEFLKEEAAVRLEVEPMSGAEVQKYVDGMVHTPADIVALGKAAMVAKDAAKRGN